MDTTLIKFNGIQYQTPEGFEFLDKSLDEYPSFCGAGHGIGDKIVPEKIGGMPCSHICHIHDESWEECEPTKVAFVKSNLMFGYNLGVYLSTGKGLLATIWRLIKGAGYVVAVSTIGWKIFKKLKGMK
jgi:hypothetical protein